MVVEPENNNDLVQALRVTKLDAPFQSLGGGSNLLISDKPDNFITLRLSGEYKEFKQIEGTFFILGCV